MRLLVFTWPYALVFWAVLFWAFAPEIGILQRPQERSSAQDAHSKALIQSGQGLAALAALVVAAALPWAGPASKVWPFWSGVGLMIAGSLLRRHCWRMLGEDFTGAVIVHRDQPVVERGAYRYVRHPSYTGGTMLFCGIGLALGNWISVLLLLAASVVVYAYRVRVEEAALEAVLGRSYRAYMERTKRFVPFLF